MVIFIQVIKLFKKHSLHTGSGDITDLFLSNGGNGYKTLPTLSITSSSGTGGRVVAYGNNVGKINSLKTVEHGKGYENAPSLQL